jgi:WhiB family redox-sensing transcriptional regulator
MPTNKCPDCGNACNGARCLPCRRKREKSDRERGLCVDCGIAAAGLRCRECALAVRKGKVREETGHEPWRRQSACQYEDFELFFHPEGEKGKARDERDELAKAICVEKCPVMLECRAWAMARREEYGVAGGLTEEERAKIWRRQDRDRVAAKRREMAAA